MFFQCIYIRQVPWEVLKTAASSHGFQHLLRDLANVNACKTMFDPYIVIDLFDPYINQLSNYCSNMCQTACIILMQCLARILYGFGPGLHEV